MEGGEIGHALLVGAPGEHLRGVDNDLRGMADMLRERGFALDVRTGERATRCGILEGYDQLIEQSRPGRPAVFYYTGHGFRAVVEKEQSRPWQGISPTDLDESTDTDFRGITAWELSIKQAQLTARTRNVTVILDCCYASQMSRDGAVSDAVPRALPHPYRLGFDEHLRALERQYGAAFSAVDPAGDRDAVRLVACGQDESAYEYKAADGQYHGIFTDALLEVLREVERVPVSWAQIDDAIRGRVVRRNALQRPDIEGPARRLLFSLDEDDGGDAVMVIAFPTSFRIAAGSLRGVADGDVFGIMPPGSRTYRAADAIGELTVTGTSATYATAALAGWKNGCAALPRGALAFPVEKRAVRRPVRIDAPGTDRDRVQAEVDASRTLRLAGAGDTALATLRLQGGALTIEDEAGPLFPATRFPDDLPGTVKNLANLAAAQAVRELAGAHGVRADEVAIEWGAVDGGRMRKMPECGASLALRDRVYVRIMRKATRPLYAHIFNIGLRGKIALLTAAWPGGVPLSGEGPDFVLGERPDGTLLGCPLGWPPGMPRETFPRLDELVVIVTSARASLRSLETVEQPVATRGGASSKLQDLLGQVQDGLPRNLRGEESVDGFFMKRLTYSLHPRDAMMADIPFAIDDNPLRQAAVRGPDAWLVPGERSPAPSRAPAAIAVRIADVVIESRRALSANLRIDALVCTRGTSDAGGYATWTRRYQGVEDGDRLDVGDGVVFRGEVRDFVDIYLWISRDGDGGLALAQLIAQRAVSPEIADATAALAMGAGARATPWIAAVGASAVLARAAYELLGGAGTTIGVYRTAFVAEDGFGAGRPAQGRVRTEALACSVLVEPVRDPAG